MIIRKILFTLLFILAFSTFNNAQVSNSKKVLNNQKLIKNGLIITGITKGEEPSNNLKGLLLLPIAPTLVAPANGSIMSGTTINFGWSSVNEATKYWMQISCDSVFTKLAVDQSIGNYTSTNIRGFLNDGTTYYWRIKAHNSDGWGNYSIAWSFTNGTAPVPDIRVLPNSLTINQTSSSHRKYIVQDTIISNYEKYLKIPLIDKNQILSTFIYSGKEIVKVIMPGKPPVGFKGTIAYKTASAITITDVPAYEWSFGCTATSASMIAAYYDRHGFPNIYTGPTNSGIMPLDNSVWGTVVINGETRSQCPLSATKNGLDGRTTRGHVDDYWIKYGNSDPDPFITNGWTEHSFGECLADYMRTNQSSYDNTDGSTSIYYYTDGTPCSTTIADDGINGMKLFFETRGYNVDQYYTQLIYGYNGNSLGFTFNNYKQEIDAGKLVLLQVQGHTMVGYGYDDETNKVYLHDTWDYNDHTMNWGGNYSGLNQWGVSVIHISANPSNTFSIDNIGNQNLSISKISNNKNWLSTTPSAPFNIAAGSRQNITVNVDWNSVNSSLDNGIITIVSNDPDEPSVAMQVTAIKSAQSIFVNSPNGGENWQIGSTHNIIWTQTNITNVKIEYTTNNGTNWSTVIATTPANSGSYPWTIPNTPSTFCRIKISDAETGTVLDESDDVFTIAVSNLVWQAVITIKDNGNGLKSLLFGASAIATDGIDTQLHEYSLPPTPPQSGIFDVRFKLPINPVDYSLEDYRYSEQTAIVWEINFQPGPGGYPVTLSWDINQFPGGSFYLKDISGAIVDINMKLLNSCVVTNPDISALKIYYNKYKCFSMSLLSGWNMVSVPVVVTDMRSNLIFSGKNSNMFGFVNGYQLVDTLKAGMGYWVRYPDTSTVNICGNTPGLNTIPVVTGWNMIGPYDKNININQITTTPESIITSQFFGFNNGYVTSDSLKTGKAFWIRVNQNGVLNLNAMLDKTSKNHAIIQVVIDKKWGKLTVKDKIGSSNPLYIGNGDINLEGYALPPFPPSGISDLRWATNRKVEILGIEGKEIIMTGMNYPIEITASGINLRLKEKTGAVDEILRDGMTMIISDPKVERMEVTEIEMPTTFNLLQNYPNPFNPETEIEYWLPKAEKVTLKIYDVLGREVETLVEKMQETGKYQIRWNADKYTSGVYLYRLSTSSFNATKKLMLIK